MTARYNTPGELKPYSDRKLERHEPASWPIEDIVQAQRLACEGKSIDEIAAAMGKPHDEVRRVVHPPETSASAKRQEMANVGYAHLKRGR